MGKKKKSERKFREYVEQFADKDALKDLLIRDFIQKRAVDKRKAIRWLTKEFYRLCARNESFARDTKIREEVETYLGETKIVKKVHKLLEEHSLLSADLKPSEKLRLQITMELKARHGQLKYTARSLHLLPLKLKQEARDIGYMLLVSNPRAKVLIDTVLSPPKKSRRREENEWSA